MIQKNNNLFLIVLIVIAIISIGWLVKNETAKTDTNEYLSIARDYGDGKRIQIELEATEFDVVAERLSGDIWVTLRPTSKETVADIREIEEVRFELSRKIVKDGKEALVHQGGSTEAIAVETNLTSGVSGDGDFIWHAEKKVGSFFYPFDRYRLYLNPNIHTPMANSINTYTPAIDLINLQFKIPNMRMEVEKLAYKTSPDDWYSIELSRPYSIQIVTGIIIALGCFWIFYLFKEADPSDYTGKIIAFFVGIWGLRSTIMNSIEIYPVLMDYIVLALSIISIIIVLSRWYASAKEVIETKKCKFCLSDVPSKATRCPNCTSHI